MQDAKWIWLSPEHFPQHQKGQATQFAPKGDFVIARFEKDVFRRKRDCRYRNFRRREISAVDKRNFNLDRSAVGGDYANAKPYNCWKTWRSLYCHDGRYDFSLSIRRKIN